MVEITQTDSEDFSSSYTMGPKLLTLWNINHTFLRKTNSGSITYFISVLFNILALESKIFPNNFLVLMIVQWQTTLDEKHFYWSNKIQTCSRDITIIYEETNKTSKKTSIYYQKAHFIFEWHELQSITILHCV